MVYSTFSYKFLNTLHVHVKYSKNEFLNEKYFSSWRKRFAQLFMLYTNV